MSKFLDDFHALLEKVTTGNGDDTAAIKALADHLTDNDATDVEQSAAILELTTKLGVSTPPEPAPAPDSVA